MAYSGASTERLIETQEIETLSSTRGFEHARFRSLIATLCNSRHRIARSRGITVTPRIVPDEFEPHAPLAVEEAGGERLAGVRVGGGFKRNAASAEAWAENEYRRPG